MQLHLTVNLSFLLLLLSHQSFYFIVLHVMLLRLGPFTIYLDKQPVSHHVTVINAVTIFSLVTLIVVFLYQYFLALLYRLVKTAFAL